MINIQTLAFDESGLIPVVVQDDESKKVLMLGYADRDSLQETLDTGLMVFYSRSRQQRWLKGETSGNYLHVRNIEPDCDQDALLVTAHPAGPTCHLGTQSCFGDHA